jgi:ABC-type transporter Mla subunit MlaD
MSGQLIGQGVHSESGKNEHGISPDHNPETSLLGIEKMHKLELELARAQGERDRLNALLDEKSRLVDEKQSLIQDQKEQIRRYFEELQITRRLLEDKTLKSDEPLRTSSAINSQQEQISNLERKLSSLSDIVSNTPERPKGFWNKLKFAFGRG